MGRVLPPPGRGRQGARAGQTQLGQSAPRSPRWTHPRDHSRCDQLVAGAPQSWLSAAGARRPKPFSMTAALVAGLSALELDADIATRSMLAQYIALLDKWNRTHNLTAIRDPEQMVTHHLLDSLAVLGHLPKQAQLRVLDIGSGGGLPGIPLAIARRDWRVVLLDSNHKKAAFLRQAAIEPKH